jgi:hypothetical protein
MSRLLFFSIVAAVIAIIVASQKGRNWAFWGIASFFFPFIAIVLLFLPSVLTKGFTKKCPHCAEIIKHDAIVCKHCKRELTIELVQCPNCGKYVPDRDYCTECHRSLTS